MQVILLERVAKLGQMGEVVNVKQGYARNFLLPQGKALRAIEANIARFQSDKAQLEARNLETKKEAEALAAKLDGKKFVVIRSASDAGALYGSVTTRDAADAATEAGFSRTDDRLSAVGDAELREDVRDVVADRLRAEHEVARDVGVRATLGYELEDLALAIGQLGERLRRTCGLSREKAGISASKLSPATVAMV